LAEIGNEHQRFMHQALSLARKGAGYVSPNPMVGSVIVKDGRVVGEGYHGRFGGPHAEVEAILSGEGKTQGATLYVTLEPCCHFGKTPPCTQAVIEAGISHVVYAVGDPNPKVSGGGHSQLEAAGIRVTKGILEPEARELNRAFFHYIQSETPYVIAKFAMSVDGKLATRTGDSRWVTSPDSRLEVMHLRHQVDAILVGAGTVVADNPQLTTRIPGHASPRHPLRVILDNHSGLQPHAEIFQPGLSGRTLLCTTRLSQDPHLQPFQKQGVEILHFPHQPDPRIPLRPLLQELHRRQIMSLLVEGGSHIHGAFFDAQLVAEIWAFIAPKVVGGKHAPSPISGQGIAKMAEALSWEWREVRQIGTDLLLRLLPVKPSISPLLEQH